MNSLKKKFGKFAVSTEKMAKVKGGTWTCWLADGGEIHLPDIIQVTTLLSFAEEGSIDGCSN
ncbi:hypothetical protein WAF17_09635 [Bernardetia sp. ABR2-2B]|uniref:hypothetical protein n=1 Tax=Bernardetia sp. ABR2-2B TaxID=3127472 RepID=UPI0030CFEE1A